MVFAYSSSEGVPFPSLVALSTHYPDCVVGILWSKASSSGETTLQNGQVKEASRDSLLGGRIPQAIELAADGTLRLALALDIGHDGMLGYCATADAETWFKLASRPDAPELLTVGGDGSAWDECWRDGHCAPVLPAQALSGTERHTLESLAAAFRAEWLWYAHAPAEQTIVELQRYAAARRPVRPINVKSIKLAEQSGIRLSSLAAEHAWVMERLRTTWAQDTTQ